MNCQQIFLFFMNFLFTNSYLFAILLVKGGKYLMYEIGKRIKYFREKAGISQKEFSQSIQQKNTTVSNSEKGLTRPNADILADICAVLNVSPSLLLDVRLPPEDMTEQERSVIMAYRTKTELQHAVNVLLGVEEEK